MHTQKHTHMDHAIFHLKAGVPATSLYLLICSLLDEGIAPTLEQTKRMWSGSLEDLREAIDELARRGILEQGPSWMPERLYLKGRWRRIV